MPPRGEPVPVTPSVLDWAIRESGYTREELARKLGVDLTVLEGWLSGTPPSLTQFRKLVARLRRPAATFLLPEPPPFTLPRVQLRRAPGDERTRLNPTEARYLREAARLQRVLGWVLEELGAPPVRLPDASTATDPERVAALAREQLGVTPEAQAAWGSPAEALAGWRDAVERVGVLVFSLPLKEGSTRGFSLVSDRIPLVAVNSAWSHPARAFTLFHEYAHLLRRSSSACVETPTGRVIRTTDPEERWCERFAAAVLLPWPQVEGVLRALGWRGEEITDLDVAKRVATRFHVSLRAATIRLISNGTATWDLYDSIPAATDRKRGGGRGQGMNRRELRERQYGDLTSDIFRRALEKEILSAEDVRGYLDIPQRDIDALDPRHHGE